MRVMEVQRTSGVYCTLPQKWNYDSAQANPSAVGGAMGPWGLLWSTALPHKCTSRAYLG